MKYKLVVFDLDGTLVNSLTDLAIATNKGLEEAGLPQHTVDEYRYFVGNGRDMLVRRAMGEFSADDKRRDTVRRVFDSYYAEHCNDNTTAYDGCAEMLRTLSDSGVMTAVLSNKPDEFVLRILNKLYPGHHFTAMWGKKHEFPPKPDGTSLKAMLESLNVSQRDCLYIGDSDVDVFTAQNGGVDMIGVEWGFRGREELISAGADAVVSEPSEITEYLGL